MAQWQTLNPHEHAHAGCRKFRGYRFAAQDHICPVQMAELVHLLPWYAMGFFPAGNDRYRLIALLGLQPGVNVYVGQDGRWLAPYVPAHFRGYPFALDKEGRLAVDLDSGLFAERPAADINPFFDERGEPAALVQNVTTFLRKRGEGLGLTQRLVDQLTKQGLLTPWRIRWKPQGHDNPQEVAGFYCVDEQRLRNLEPAAHAELARSGAMGLAYAQIFSQARLVHLRSRHRRLARSGPTVVPDGLDELFGGRGDEFTFDFDD